MTRIDLDTPFLEQGIQNVNFFNGRILTGRDMEDEQKAHHQQRQQLGQAVGAGVVFGLRVSTVSTGANTTTPILNISRGLAFNRLGQALALPAGVEVNLVRPQEIAIRQAGLFADCLPPTLDVIYTGVGMYVLLMAPVSGFQERAPMHGLNGEGRAGGCGFRYAVEGVRFRLLKLDVSDLTIISSQLNAAMVAAQNDAAALSYLRNVMAHFCLGTPQLRSPTFDPFQELDLTASAPLINPWDTLKTTPALEECEVGLGLLFWNDSGIKFVDNWAVRRLIGGSYDLLGLSPQRHKGLERLYQFLDQLQYLFNTLGGLSSIRVQDYFRFLPPAAFFPVQTAGSIRGFHLQRFFEAFTTGTPGRLGRGNLADILKQSLSYPAVDLTSEPVFQIYAVAENVAAVTAGESGQRYHLFVSRDLHGPLAQDGVAHTLQDAWDVYRGLIKRRVFLPPATDPDKIVGQMIITSALRDVLDTANRLAALAAGRALATPDTLQAFREMYEIQQELATLFQSNIPGIVHTQGRETFGQTLETYLNTTTPGDEPGLQPSVQAEDLIAAVNAQDAINHFVGSWSGEGVAIGPLIVRYQQSPDGVQVVPGDNTANRQLFTLTNGTDKRLTISLEASISALSGDWSESSRIHHVVSGQEISEVALNSGAQTVIEVWVFAPDDAVVGDPVILSLMASVPPPTDKSAQDSITLTVAEEPGEPVVNSVSFDTPAQVVPPDIDLSDLPPSPAGTPAPVSFLFNLNYSAPEGPETTQFLFTVNLTSPTLAEWIVGFPGVAPATPSPGVFTRTVTLSTAAPTPVEVIIRTPAARGAVDKTASFTVAVASTELEPAISAEYPDPFALRVRAAS